MKLLVTKHLSWDTAFWPLLIGLSAAFIYQSARIHVFLASDPVTQFAPEVVALLAGQGIKAFTIDPYRGPLFPTLVAGVAWLLRGNVFVAGQVIEVIAYALFILTAFVVIRAVYGSRVAFLTAAGVGACAPLILTGLAWLTDNLFAALALLSLWCMLAAGRRWPWMALAAGLLAGLAFDTRWTGTFLLGVGLAAAVINPWRARPPRQWLWLLVFAAGFLVTAVPWLAVNDANQGSPFFVRIIPGVLEGSLISPRLGSAPSLTALVFTDPAFFFPRYLLRLSWNEWFQVSTIVPLLLAIFIPAGAVMLLRGLDRRKLLLLSYTGIFWSIAILTHFEPRYFYPMLPALMALPWLFLLSGALPDLRLRGRLSLTLCLLVVVLMAISVNQFRSAIIQSAGTDASFEPQVEVAKLLANPAPGSVKGTRVVGEYYSGARYFIPHYSGLPVDYLKPNDYLNPPAGYSHVLVEEAVPLPKAPSSLLDPLKAGPQLEAIYYKSVKPRVVLYQIIADNQVWPLQTATVSSALDDAHGPAAVLDGDSQSGWLTPPAATAAVSATLTADIGQVLQMDRIWLLPSPNSALFPESYRIDVSMDGAAWTPVALVDHDPLNQRQNPRVFAFAAMPARFVRFTALRLRANTAGQYQAGLNALRISLSGASQPAKP